MRIKLQGIAEQEAIKAKDLKIGDITIWNYGFKEKVVEKSFSKTGKTVILKVKSEDGCVFTRNLRAERLVAIDLDFNRMCMNCKKLRDTCTGEKNKFYTGCIYKEEK
jgi:hypothetical protein